MHLGTVSINVVSCGLLRGLQRELPGRKKSCREVHAVKFAHVAARSRPARRGTTIMANAHSIACPVGHVQSAVYDML